MAGNGIPTLGRVKVCDLLPTEGIPSDSYKLAVTTLSQSLAQYSAAIIQFPPPDGALLRSGLDSARLYFHQRDSYPQPTTNDMIHQHTTTNTNDPREWCKTSGYYSDPHSWQESYEYRPGLTFTEAAASAAAATSMEFPPSGLPDIFGLLGKASRLVLDAIGFYLNLRSSPFTEILDNVPLRSNEVSSSVLSVCCYARPSFHGGHLTTEDEQLLLYSDHDHQLDKSLISFVKSDKPGLHIRDMHGQWVLVDVDLGPQEAVVYPGLALYQATAGYVSPAVYRTDLNSMQGSIEGRFSLAFKLMPKSMTSMSCSEMRAAGHGVEAQFQVPVLVDDFMQRPHSNDELFNRQTLQSFSVPQSQDGSMKQMKKRKKSDSRLKPLPPSKRLRLEAQRVLKERVQEIADKKGIKLRFCNPKDCESNHNTINSPCAHIKMEIGWPQGVPFVHPHDLPNKAKIGFLETYEPGWSETHDMELSLSEAAQGNQHVT
ncbi:2-oxoglutarate [Hirschfeldia incana]|nr:2-oxoglutarate [Hirschfeldia incana]KAJ0263927.1 2-oxoglutarate [Hirschfeldia incana]